MAKPSKRSGGQAIGLRPDLFTRARIKLSALYLLMVAAILAAYSVAIYTNANERARDVSNGIRSPEEQTFYDQAVDQTRSLIFLVDGAVFIAAAGLSYLLAGYTLRPIKKAWDAQAEFSADASHELRTPLTVMRTGIEVLLRSGDPLSAKTEKVLRSNLEEIQSMSLMAEQLLALSRGEESSPDEFQNLDFATLVAATVDKFAAVASEKHIRLSKSGIAPARICGDAASLERMLKNILSNAIAYTPPDGSISVTLASDGKTATVTVADTGRGIADKDLPHIYGRFYKADNARTGGESGSGLGLSIVKQIVENHKGNVAIESTLGKGTTVVVRLPAIS